MVCTSLLTLNEHALGSEGSTCAKLWPLKRFSGYDGGHTDGGEVQNIFPCFCIGGTTMLDVQTKLTYADYLKTADDERYELLGGALVKS